MKKRRFFRMLYLVLPLLTSSATMAAINSSLTADEVMQRNFHVAKINTISTDATMVLINGKGQQRERKIISLSRLQADGVNVDLNIRFDLPADVRGTKFLQIQHADRDDDMWIYLPALKRSRRLVSNNKRDSFVGSDFSYADILPLKPSLFRHALLRSETCDSHECYVIESVPQEDSLKKDLGYSRRVSWIRKDNFVETRVEYYDGAQLFKTQNTANHTQVSSDPPRWLALRREMIDHQSQHKTLITIDKIDIKALVPARTFTVEALERN